MKKNILITGATDGIGLLTSKQLLKQGHRLWVHGRSQTKLDSVVAELAELGDVTGLLADLSDLNQVNRMAQTLLTQKVSVDVLINNAGVFKTPVVETDHGIDARFVVNLLAPVLLTRMVVPLFTRQARVINLSSAAQAPVDLEAMFGGYGFDDMAAYAQSKLALTMWTCEAAIELARHDVMMCSVNPGSLLASKMVKEGFGVAGSDLSIGSKILCQAALEDRFQDKAGAYFDNDSHDFAAPHSDALSRDKNQRLLKKIEGYIAAYL